MFGADALIEGRFLIDGRIKQGFLEVSMGRIIRFHNSHSGSPTHRFPGGMVLPAALDIHVHMRDPDPNPAEDVFHGTKAAALGGVTTIMDMPNNSPPVTTEEVLVEKLRNHAKKACVDFGIYTGVPEGGFSAGAFTRIVRISPIFKAYLGSTTGDMLIEVGDIAKFISSSLGTQGVPITLISIHAEDEEALRDVWRERETASGGGGVDLRGLADHERLRPLSCELAALDKLSGCLRSLHTPTQPPLHPLQSKQRAPPPAPTLHIAHTTAESAIFKAEEARKAYLGPDRPQTPPSNGPQDGAQIPQTPSSGIPSPPPPAKGRANAPETGSIGALGPVGGEFQWKPADPLVNNGSGQIPHHLSIVPGRLTIEATPHHLLLNTEYEGGLLGKVNPPLRDRKEQVNLLRALVDGRIDVVASDHAPHPLASKEAGGASTPSGIPGVQTMYPLLLQQSVEKRVDLAVAVRVLSENPGRLMGVNKGRIAPGYRADLVHVDLDESLEITDDIIASACGWTPYRGHKGVFPGTVMMGGEAIVEDGQFTGGPGAGRFLGTSSGTGGV